MKVIRAPLRVSLFGGGTDLDPFCSEHGSTIISFAINRHIYLIWNPRPTGGCRLHYSQVEELETLRDAKHTLVSQAAIWHGIDEPCTLTIVSDVPKGTGLGSSSALAVCLMSLLQRWLPSGELVGKAHAIEAVHSRAGWQDYLPAAFGGFHCYHITNTPSQLPHPQYDVVEWHGRNEFAVGMWAVPAGITDIINTHGLLLYTGASRPADSVLPSWQKSEDELMQIKWLADEVAKGIDGLGVQMLGNCLDKTWQLKRQISGVTNPGLNRQYAQAIMNGALGGKLCGAGAGGCWFFLVPPEKRDRVKQALGLREISFQIAEKGVETWEL